VPESRSTRRPYWDRILPWRVYAVLAIICAVIGTVCLLKLHGDGRVLLVSIIAVLTLGCVIYACVGYRRGR